MQQTNRNSRRRVMGNAHPTKASRRLTAAFFLRELVEPIHSGNRQWHALKQAAMDELAYRG